MRRSLSIVVALVLWTASWSLGPHRSASAQSLEHGVKTSSAAIAHPKFEEAWTAYHQRTKRPRHVYAAELLAKIAAERPGNAKAQIWCARTAYYCAHRFRDDDKKEMVRIAKLGLSCAQTIKRKHPKNHDAKLWAMLAEFKYKAANAFIPSVSDAEKVLNMLRAMKRKHPKDPRVLMMLGSLYRELPGWPISIGDEEKALTLHQNAIRLAPNNAELLLELASSYKALGHDEAAKRTYKKCIHKGRGHPDLTWETKDAQAWAKKMLAELD